MRRRPTGTPVESSLEIERFSAGRLCSPPFVRRKASGDGSSSSSTGGKQHDTRHTHTHTHNCLHCNGRASSRTVLSKRAVTASAAAAAVALAVVAPVQQPAAGQCNGAANDKHMSKRRCIHSGAGELENILGFRSSSSSFLVSVVKSSVSSSSSLSNSSRDNFTSSTQHTTTSKQPCTFAYAFFNHHHHQRKTKDYLIDRLLYFYLQQREIRFILFTYYNYILT